MSWSLQGASAVGCTSVPWSSAPFGRGALVLAHDADPDARMILGRHENDGGISGELMRVADWNDLLACEETVELARPVALASSELRPKGWLLRSNFPAREVAAEQLRRCEGAVLYEESRDGVLLFVVDEARAGGLLEQWSRAAFDRAWQLGQRGEWVQAHEQADLAWLTDITLELDRVALLALAVEFIEGASAAEDFVAFELQSRKPRPEQALRQRIADYRLQFAAPRRPSPLALSVRALERSGRTRDVDAWKRELPEKNRVFPHPRALQGTLTQQSS